MSPEHSVRRPRGVCRQAAWSPRGHNALLAGPWPSLRSTSYYVLESKFTGSVTALGQSDFRISYGRTLQASGNSKFVLYLCYKRILHIVFPLHFEPQVCTSKAIADEHDMKNKILELGHGPIDVLADVAGGNNFAELFETIGKGGCYTTAGAIAGPIVELDLRILYLNDLEMHGCTVYDPSVFKALIGYIEEEKVAPMVGGVFDLQDINSAQEEFSKKQHVGAMVLKVD